MSANCVISGSAVSRDESADAARAEWFWVRSLQEERVTQELFAFLRLEPNK